jgi:hypothetical protein
MFPLFFKILGQVALLAPSGGTYDGGGEGRTAGSSWSTLSARVARIKLENMTAAYFGDGQTFCQNIKKLTSK